MKCIKVSEDCATGYIDDGRGLSCVSELEGCYPGF